MRKADRDLLRTTHQIVNTKAAEYAVPIALHRVQRLLAIIDRQALLLRRYRGYARRNGNASVAVRRDLEQP